ncbi:thiamine biosynthesis protein ThiJ [Arcobacter sp. FW59]|nr:thiamine biosynthesis protein ThiJ [Arcobacter sp. FW59]
MNNRRKFISRIASAFLFSIGSQLMATDIKNKENKIEHDMLMPEDWTKDEQIALLIFPGFTALDLIGPQYMFASLMGAKVHIVSETLEPVTSDTNITILPTITYDKVPDELTVLFIPGGGESVIKALENKKLMNFVREKGKKAKYITSTCTGSLILAGAGLLNGYKATSHWMVRELLVAGGAIPTDERVVIDRNRLTGAGVTAGIDLGLTIISLLRDELYAKSVQLLAEYSPKPPFNAGTPDTAPKESVNIIQDMFQNYNTTAKNIIEKAFNN